MIPEKDLKNRLYSTEEEILAAAQTYILSQYRDIQGQFIFIKIHKNKGFELGDLVVFSSWDDLMNHFWSFEYSPACLMIQYREDHFQIYFGGYTIGGLLEVTPDGIQNSTLHSVDYNREEGPRPPRELVENGLAEIQAALSASRSPKAV